MKRLNTFSLYELGRVLIKGVEQPVPTGDTPLSEFILPFLRIRNYVQFYILGPGGRDVFSSSTKRAATGLVNEINELSPDLDNIDFASTVSAWNVAQLIEKAKDLQTVLTNDLPGLPIYYVSQKGIFNTDDLISKPECQLTDTHRQILPAQAKTDIQESGKCLAFELPTATAFHMARAIETVMDTYYYALSGKTFKQDNITTNWGEYVKALNKQSNVDKKVTAFLDHVRSEYRNPISHPDETLSMEEAFNFFGVGLNAIGMTLRAVHAVPKPAQLAAVPSP